MKLEILLDRISGHIRTAPNRLALTFLRDDGTSCELSYGELGSRVDALAHSLAGRAEPGERALLLHPAGIEFVIAFLATQKIGIVAIPLNLPSKPRVGGRLESVLHDAQPSLVLTTVAAGPTVSEHLRACKTNIPVVHTDNAEIVIAERQARPDKNSISFIQYTSGSTANPKGVVVDQQMLSTNLEQLADGFNLSEKTVMVGWLPLFHDMGLIGNLLSIIYAGGHHVFMSPAAFLQRPMKWLEAISTYRGTIAGCPNFGWQLCVRHAAAAAPDLNLSSLEIAYVGAEPIRADTLKEFGEAYGRFGFDPGKFFACYGLAEATLFVSGAPLVGPNAQIRLDRSELEAGSIISTRESENSTTLVSCGRPASGTTIKIVSPDTAHQLPDAKVGEIWVSGDSVSKYYYSDPQNSDNTFGNVLKVQDGRKYLRTGDLGFLLGGELYVTGRIKDMLIIRGRNIYPQDVEALVERSLNITRPNSCAAFAIDKGGEDRLTLVVEADRALVRSARIDCSLSQADDHRSRDPLTATIRAAVTSELSVRIDDIVFVRPGTFPRTSSGKIQRLRCKSMYINNELSDIFSSASDVGRIGDVSNKSTSASSIVVDDLINWFRQYSARRIDFRLMDERRSVSPHVVLDLGNKGFFGWQVPAEFGGLNLNNSDVVRIAEQLAAVDVSLGLMVGIHNCLGLRTVLKFGKTNLKRDWLSGLAQGRQFAAFALTETDAGSNPSVIRTQARRIRGGWRLNGEKRWIGLAAWSSIITVIAKAVDEDGSALGTIALAVPISTLGVEQGSEARTLGVKSIVQNRIAFINVDVLDDHVLGEVGRGIEVAQDAMMFSRFCLAAVSTGVMKRCTQLIARYAASRTIATGRLIDNAVTRERLIDITCGIEALGALTRVVADRLDHGAEVPSFAHLCCKIAGPELAFASVDALVQLLGARGYEEANPAAQLFRDTRLLRIFEGATEALAVHLGANVVRDATAFVSFLTKDLNSPDVALQFTNVLRQLKSVKQPYVVAQGVAQSQWLHYHLGLLAADAFLWAAAQSASIAVEFRSVVNNWARDKFNNRFALLSGRACDAEKVTSRELLLKISEYDSSVGVIKSTSPGEEWAGDELLQALSDKEQARSAAPKSEIVVQDENIKRKIQSVIVEWARSNAGYKSHSVDDNVLLETLGVDSLGAAEIGLEIERSIGVSPPIDILLEFNTISKLASWCEMRSSRQVVSIKQG